jgi:hypothetical protein
MNTKNLFDFLLCYLGKHDWKNERPKPLLTMFGLIITFEKYRYCQRCLKRQIWEDIYGDLNKIGKWIDIVA